MNVLPMGCSPKLQAALFKSVDIFICHLLETAFSTI